ncbi:MAG TPA: PDZ domain-containing protein, partial [Longimicrobiales bacterium]|nr:PDZ domain-containing protein [Longimicrobiales bacterium]
ENGSWRNLTNSSGVADRHPTWSPDGSTLAWFNDEQGEYALILADQDGGDPRRVAVPDPSFYYDPQWSPDGTRLAFTDTDYRVLVMDVASGRITDVDGESYANPGRSPGLAWSPDSRWLAYTKRLHNLLRAAFVFDTETGETHQVTDGMADVITPRWDASGKYMYLLASTDFGLNTSWLDMSSYDRPSTRAMYLAVLADGEPSPFLPRSDEEEVEGDEGGGASGERAEEGGGGADADTGRDAPTVTIDFDGLASRILDVPGLPVRDYQGLVAGPEGHVFVLENRQGGDVLLRYSLEDREPEEFVEGVSDAVVSHDRRRLLVRTGANWSIVGTDRAPSGDDGRLAFDDLRVRVEPPEEWAQMLREGWRFMRDYLYVDNAHGAPWDDVWEWYSAWLPDVGHRSDFNALLDMLSGEIAVGHSYVRGGDYPDLEGPRTGLLGADLEEVDGRYRIARIYPGAGWTPGLEGPLAAPGVGVEEGDFLLAVEGRELAPPTNPYMLFEGTAGRTITVTVNDTPSMDGARDVLVEPVGDDGQLRSQAWVEGNRRRVDELSDGRLAYVYLPNTGRGGYTSFNRMYFAQQDRQGAVLDERNNGGGSAADYIIEVLERELTGYFNSRTPENRPFTQPQAGLWGPKVMIINGRAGSGGDLMPYLFRFKGIGPLVGTRTWGGLVGTWDTPDLIDGGNFVAPRGGFFDVDGEWAVEGEGIAPDIEVRNDPAPVIE